MPVTLALVLLSSLPAAAGTARVDVCHQSDGHAYHPIRVSERAVAAHLAHGDWIVTAEDHDDGLDNDCDGDIDEFHSLGGSLSFESEWEGDLACEAVIDLVGTPYAGECNDCTFGFDVDATVVERDPADCGLLLYWSFLFEDVPPYTDTRLFFWEAYTTYWGSTYDNVLAAGYSFDLSYYGYGVYGPYLYPLAWDGHWMGNTATYADGRLDWALGPLYMLDYRDGYGTWTMTSIGYADVE